MTIAEHTVTPEWVNIDKLIDPELRDRALHLARKLDKAHAKLEDTISEAMRLGPQIAELVAQVSGEYDAGTIPSDESLREVIAGLAGWTQLNAALGSLSDATNIEDRLRSDRYFTELEHEVEIHRTHPDLPRAPRWLDLRSIVTDADRAQAADVARKLLDNPDGALSDGTISESRDLYRRIDQAAHKAMGDIPHAGPLASSERVGIDFDDAFHLVIDVLTGSSVLSDALKKVTERLDPNEISAETVGRRQAAEAS